MLAMEYRGPLRVRTVSKPEPRMHHPEDAIVRVVRSCICGSDLHLYNGEAPNTRVGTTPVEVYAFHMDVPEGASHLEVSFQHLSPTTSGQGEVSVTTDILLLHWGRTVLYPAAYFACRLQVRPQLPLSPDWPFATALQVVSADDGLITFETRPLDTLVAGREPLPWPSWQRSEEASTPFCRSFDASTSAPTASCRR